METNENAENKQQPTPPVPAPAHVSQHVSLEITFEGQTYLKEAGRWAGFLGIVGFIACGLLLIAAFFIGTIFSILGHMSSGLQGTAGDGAAVAGIAGGFAAVLLILLDVLYFFFALYLYQFSARIKKGLLFEDNIQVTQAFGKLKSFFKLAGIVTIIALSLYALEIIIVVLVGIASVHH